MVQIFQIWRQSRAVTLPKCAGGSEELSKIWGASVFATQRFLTWMWKPHERLKRIRQNRSAWRTWMTSTKPLRPIMTGETTSNPVLDSGILMLLSCSALKTSNRPDQVRNNIGSGSCNIWNNKQEHLWQMSTTPSIFCNSFVKPNVVVGITYTTYRAEIATIAITHCKKKKHCPRQPFIFPPWWNAWIATLS